MNTYGNPIPNRLLVPGESNPVRKPPPSTRSQQLPTDEMSFENFQRLSVRLLSVMKCVVHCQEYGTPGQDQEGIDLYARLPNQSKIEVWQCKRYEKITASTIKYAVEEFLNGKLVADTFKFVLVTTAETEANSLADADQAAAKELQKHQIEFSLIGRTQLTVELKKYPEIIDDFFGREWVTECCGAEISEQLGQRLSAQDVPIYRKKLGDLYLGVFEQADAFQALTSSKDHAVSLPLSQRWVMPTLSCKQETAITPLCDTTSQDSEQENSPDGTQRGEPQTFKRNSKTSSASTEMSAEAFVGSTEQGVILGDPGSGKSTLLRVIALDLLSENPSMRLIAQRFGNRLPVWLPFAFLSTRVSSGDSIPDAAAAWIRKNGGDTELEQLLKRAICDNRLLLLIDGLDEWSDPDRAREAIVAIKGFLSQHPAGCFVTARPLGYDRLDHMSGDWKHGTLQALSHDQQAALVSLSLECVQPKLAHPVRQVEVDRFMRQLRLEETLDQLSSTPLMLVGLLSLWIRNKTLPSSRLAVCESLIKEMMEDHPSRRASISASNITLSSLQPPIRRGALASLAWAIHTSTDGVFLEHKEAENSFVRYFEETEGMLRADAKSYARLMLPISDQIIGVLSEASSGGDIQFVHRTFQELLAAEHLSSQPIENQEQQCKDHAGDPSWHQVLLFLIQKSNRPHETDKLISALGQEKTALRDEQMAKLLIAEAIFSQVRMSPSFRVEHANYILDNIECGTWMPLRVALLNKTLQAPAGSNVYALLVERLKAWTPKPGNFYVYDALAEWPQDSGAEDAIWSLMNSEDVYQQIRAAKALSLRCQGQEAWKKRLLDRLNQPLPCEALGVCLISLANGWATDADVIKVFEQGGNAKSPEIVLPSILGLVNAGRQDQHCKDQLLRQKDPIYYSEIAVEAALKGWPKDRDIKAAVLSSLSGSYSSNRIFGSEAAWRIAIQGYPGDDDVARLIAIEIAKEHSSFSYHISRELLMEGFSGHPLITDACNEHLNKSKRMDVYDDSLIAALARTEESKKRLIEWAITNEGMGFHAANALLWTWGKSDPEVSEAMEQIRQDNTLITTYASVLAATENDKKYSRNKLLKAVSTDKLNIFSCLGIINALGSLRTEQPDNEVVDTLFSYFEREPEQLKSPYGGYALINNFGDHPKVRALAEQWMEDFDCQWSTIAKVYSGESEIQNRIKRMCRCQPDELRLQIMFRCRQRATYDPEFRLIAEVFKFEENTDVRVIGAITLAESMISQNEDTTDLANYFAKETTATGPRYEARLQAGIAGLISLGQLSRIQEQKLFNDKTPKINFGYSPNCNNILEKYILRNWQQLKQSLGDTLWDYFDSDRELEKLREHAKLVDQLAIAEEIIFELRKRAPTSKLGLALLAENNVPGWVDACFAAMGLTTGCRSVGVAEAHEASRLVAKYGANDNTIKKQLEDFVKNNHGFCYSALETLARGWPNSEALKSAWEKASVSHPYQKLSPILISTCATAQQFTSWLYNWLEERASDSNHWKLTDNRWFVMRRCFKDIEVATLLLQKLQNSISTNEWVSLPWLIRSSSLENANQKLREWAEQHWRTSAEKDWCVFGFDLFKSEYVPLKESLLDLLLTDKQYNLN